MATEIKVVFDGEANFQRVEIDGKPILPRTLPISNVTIHKVQSIDLAFSRTVGGNHCLWIGGIPYCWP